MGASKVRAEEDDGDIEREIAEALWKNHRLLPPTNKHHDRCRAVLYWFMIYICFYIPMQVAFEMHTGKLHGNTARNPLPVFQNGPRHCLRHQ